MTKIEWATLGLRRGVTWNPIRAKNTVTGKRGWHCERVSEACRNCYAERLNAKPGDTGGTGLPYKPGHRLNGEIEVYLDEKTLLAPLHWKSPRGIFPCSMTDIFGEWVPDEWLDRIFAVMALCPQHRFAVLTKRPKRMRNYIGMRACDWLVVLPEAFGPGDLQITKHQVVARLGKTTPEHRALYHVDTPVSWPLPNVYFGVTAEDQLRADECIPDLLATPAAVRFVSIEPMLGEIHLDQIQIIDEGEEDTINALTGEQFSNRTGCEVTEHPALDWIIVGGESGPGARDNNFEANARSVLAQCRAAGVAFFGKQNVRKRQLPSDLDIKEFPEGGGAGAPSNATRTTFKRK